MEISSTNLLAKLYFPIQRHIQKIKEIKHEFSWIVLFVKPQETNLSFHSELPLRERPERVQSLGGLQGLLVGGESLQEYKLTLEIFDTRGIFRTKKKDADQSKSSWEDPKQPNQSRENPRDFISIELMTLRIALVFLGRRSTGLNFLPL